MAVEVLGTLQSEGLRLSGMFSPSIHQLSLPAPAPHLPGFWPGPIASFIGISYVQ